MTQKPVCTDNDCLAPECNTKWHVRKSNDTKSGWLVRFRKWIISFTQLPAQEKNIYMLITMIELAKESYGVLATII